VRADIRLGWMSAFRPKPAIQLELAPTTANDPQRAFGLKA